MKYGADEFKGVTPRKRARQPLRKIVRKQERRFGKKEIQSYEILHDRK